MKKTRVLITGSAGLVGGAAVRLFAEKGYEVHGIDNNSRRKFFGIEGDTSVTSKLLVSQYKNYHHHHFDLRSALKLRDIFKKYRFNLIIHAAAQPSHDWAAENPIIDFAVNAQATLSLLDLTKQFSGDAVFIFTSTNKVYGDTVNALPFQEKSTRWDLSPEHPLYRGVNESTNIDNSMHSIFGVSKTSADLMVQEYGKYFGLATTVFRIGCIAGPAQAAVNQHGFLGYLVRCIKTNRTYTIYGYKGKQVRDNIHVDDLVRAFYEVYKNPGRGDVFNIGGSRHSNISILEAVKKIEQILEKKARIAYVNTARRGDHRWFITDVRKFTHKYPKWKYQFTFDELLSDLCR